MRPKKVILCFNSDKQELSAVKYTLWISGYKVLEADNAQEALAAFATAPVIDLALVDDCARRVRGELSGSELIVRLKRMAPHVPMILVVESLNVSDEWDKAKAIGPDATLTKYQCRSVELLERIRVMCARKRGPRKGAQRVNTEVQIGVACS